MKYIRSLDGNAAVEELSIKGPFFNPQDWHFVSRGTLNNLKVSSKQLPRPLSIDRGQFSWSPAVFALTNIDASLGKSTIMQLSASFELDKRSSFDLQSKSVNLAAG